MNSGKKIIAAKAAASTNRKRRRQRRAVGEEGMKRTGLIAVMVIGGVAAFGSPAQAQLSEARIQELIKQAAENVAREKPQAPQTQAGGAARPTVKITLEDAVKYALERNLDIAVQRLNPQINDLQISSVRSVYRPALTSQLSTQSTTTPSTSTISGTNNAGEAVVSSVGIFNGGLAQSVPWGGGAFSVTLNNNRSTTTSLNTL